MKGHRSKTAVGMGFPNPEEAFAGIYAKIPRHIRLSFAAACVLGLFIHLYSFTNKLPNHDDIGHLLGSDYGSASGRWLLPILLRLDGSFSAPWLIGALSVLLLAVAVCFTVTLLRIRRPLACILTAAVLVSFPAAAATFTYMFSADAYFFSLALACLAAYLTSRYSLGFIGGAVALVLSLSVYQSYLGVTAALLVAVLIFDTLDGKLSIRQLLARALRFALALALGVVGYLICVRLTTRGTELVDYMGISSMGSVSVAALPWLIKRAFLAYRDFFLGSSGGAHPAFLKYAFALTTAATAGLGVAILREKRLNWQRILLLVLLIAAYPLAGNLIYLMAPAAEVHLLMVYGMVYILLAPLAAAEYAGTLTAEGPARGKIYAVLRALCCWVIAGTLAVTAFGYAVYTNAAYLKMDLSYEQAYAYSIRLVSAIEGADGYAEGMPVVLVGEALGESGQKANPELDALQMAGVADMKELVNSYSYGHFLRRFTGLASPVYTAGTDVSARYAALESVERMSAYPAQGSVLVIDGHIVVKFA